MQRITGPLSCRKSAPDVFWTYAFLHSLHTRVVPDVHEVGNKKLHVDFAHILVTVSVVYIVRGMRVIVNVFTRVIIWLSVIQINMIFLILFFSDSKCNIKYRRYFLYCFDSKS